MMIETVQRFVTGGREYKTHEEASRAASFDGAIRQTFAFYDKPDDPGCRFSNGGWSIERDGVFYQRLLSGIYSLVMMHHPGIASSISKSKRSPFSIDDCGGMRIVGRYLDDYGSPLYEWWCIQAQICPECFREWGQPYYANNCPHRDQRGTLA